MLDGTQKIILLTTLEKEAIDYPSILGKHWLLPSLSQAFPWNYNHFIMCTTQLRKVASNFFIFIFIFYFYAYLPLAFQVFYSVFMDMEDSFLFFPWLKSLQSSLIYHAFPPIDLLCLWFFLAIASFIFCHAFPLIFSAYFSFQLLASIIFVTQKSFILN